MTKRFASTLSLVILSAVSVTGIAHAGSVSAEHHYSKYRSVADSDAVAAPYVVMENEISRFHYHDSSKSKSDFRKVYTFAAQKEAEEASSTATGAINNNMNVSYQMPDRFARYR